MTVVESVHPKGGVLTFQMLNRNTLKVDIPRLQYARGYAILIRESFAAAAHTLGELSLVVG